MNFTNGIPFRSEKSCGQCGLYHNNRQEKCCAKMARCNKCNRIGHFARVCLRPAVMEKSNQSKLRDQERMTTFIRRKTAEYTFPFYNEDDAYFKKNQTNNSVSNVSTAEFQKLKSLTDSMTKTIYSLKAENIALVFKNQRLKDFNEKLQDEVSIKKLEISQLKETFFQNNNSLKEKIRTDSSKLEIMDKLILEFKKLNDDYEQLRLKHNQKAYEIMMMESRKKRSNR